ncbi:hypothetical protein AB1Y20_006665 [Prymnesium parvum]
MASVTRREILRKVPFGRSGMMVTECCLGSMTWGSFNGKEEEAFAQLDRAILEHGVNFIDTAEMYPVAYNYGKTTEKWIGNWLALRSQEDRIKRSDLYIATKANPSRVGGFPDGETRPNDYCYSFDADLLEHSCRSSIARLQCEYIDLYQLHWPSRDVPVFGCMSFHANGEERPVPFKDDLPAGTPGYEVFERQVAAVKKLLDAGLIKHWGLSNENAFGITMFCVAADKLGCPRPVSCQNDFSLLNRTYENDTWEAAYRFGVVGLPYGVLAGGTLTGKYFQGTKYAVASNADRPLAKCRHRSNPEFQPRYQMPMAMLAAKGYVELAEKYAISPTELAIAWANERKCNGAVIIGATTISQLDECVGAFRLELSEQLMTAVDELHEQFRYPTMYINEKQACVKAKWLLSPSRKVPGPLDNVLGIFTRAPCTKR